MCERGACVARNPCEALTMVMSRNTTNLPRRARRPAFTLIEATFSVVIVAVVLTSAVQALGVAARAGLQQKEQGRAAELARQLFAEIAQAHYAEPNTTPTFGNESGETARSSFDDVDDYDKWTENPPRSRDGAALPGFTGWKRRTVVDWVRTDDANDTVGYETGLKRIKVTVTSPTGRQTAFRSLRSKYSGYERSPPASTSYPSWVGVTVQVGTDPAGAAVAGANLVNQAP